MATDSATSRYAKARGYTVEQQALKALSEAFPKLKRVGSVGYSKAHADLIQVGETGHPVTRLVVTRAKRGPLLVTLSVEDFLEHVGSGIDWVPVVVQVKARATSYVDTVYRELKEATS